MAEYLQQKLTENKYLNKLITNIPRERGMSAIYLGNASPTTHRSLVAQRTLVDTTAQWIVTPWPPLAQAEGVMPSLP